MDEVTLPNEIWLKIFKWMDIPALMRLRLVCHRFYDLIEDILNKHPKWKKLASEDIYGRLYMEVMTMQRVYPYIEVLDSNIDDPVLWRGTYLSYKKWQRVLANPYTKNTIAPTTNEGHITYFCTFDKYIAIASNDGSIECYTSDDISQPFYIAKHGTRVIQVEFWYSNGDVLIVSVGDDNKLKFWDIQSKTEIPTEGYFASSICSGECRHFCLGAMGGTLTSYQRFDEISPDLTYSLDLRDDDNFQDDNIIIAIHHDGRHLIAAIGSKTENDILSIYLYRIYLENGQLYRIKWTDKCTLDCNWNFLVQKFKSSYQELTVYHACTFFLGIGEDSVGSLVIYEREWQEYHMDQHFGASVKSIALHAGILMFGLEDGSVRLLYIRSSNDVIELEESIKGSKKIEVTTEPIVHLTILEVDKKPCIVAATSRNVHLINFF